MLDPTDTIVAVASPPGGGTLGLVRVTGPSALAVAGDRFEPDGDGDLGSAGRAGRLTGWLRVAGLRRPLAVSLNLWPGPATYTGQPLVEIVASGAEPILAAILADCLARGARLAEPGEFTLRAFLAGRIDLTQSEAVLGVIDAATPDQLDVALLQLAGGLARPLTRLRDDLADMLAFLEANLDFAEEADVDPVGRGVLAASIQKHADAVAELADQLGSRDRPASRPRVVLVGPPNAGKSRLFNALVGRPVALVGPVAGTTRDYLEAACECDGLVVDLVDTAGTEPAATEIDRQAQAAKVRQARRADLLIHCCASGDSPPEAGPGLTARTKADLIKPPTSAGAGTIWTSSVSGMGLVDLRAAIARTIRHRTDDGPSLSIAGTAARCVGGLSAAARSLNAAAEAVAADLGDELVAVDLRQAVDDLGRVVGAVVTDDLLDRIFRRFCIGK